MNSANIQHGIASHWSPPACASARSQPSGRRILALNPDGSKRKRSNAYHEDTEAQRNLLRIRESSWLVMEG